MSKVMGTRRVKNSHPGSKQSHGAGTGCEEAASAATPVTMAQVSALASKNDKALQLLIENFRRSGTNTPLWLSSTPYYKKDSMLVINLRDENLLLSFPNEPLPDPEKGFRLQRQSSSDVKQKAAPTSNQSIASKKVAPPPKSFAVSGGEAASRLGLRIGSATDTKDSASKHTEDEVTILGNVKNLGPTVTGWDTMGLDSMLGGAVSVDPLSINSDPLWGADTVSTSTGELELQNMLSVLKDLPSVSLDQPDGMSSKTKPDYSKMSSTYNAPLATSQSGSLLHESFPQQSTVTNPSTGQQFCCFMSPQGVPVMFPVTSTPQPQPQYMQMMSANQQLQVQAQLQAQLVQQQQQQRALYAQQQMLFQGNVVSNGVKQPAGMLAAQQAYAQQAAFALQQQQLASQQAALVAQQLLSKGPSKVTPPNSGPSNDFKSPNPNARPFQPQQEKRFNVAAPPFVPPSGR